MAFADCWLAVFMDLQGVQNPFPASIFNSMQISRNGGWNVEDKNRDLHKSRNKVGYSWSSEKGSRLPKMA